MKSFLLLLLVLFVSVFVYAQVPQSFNYQAVVRSVNGDVLPNQNIGVRISLLQGSNTGNAIYSETFNVTTNNFGLINLQIGTGASTDQFEAIDWAAGPYFMKVEIDENGGTNYVEISNTQLLSVPYALYAQNTNDGDTDPNNELQILSISNDTLYLSNGGQVYLGGYSNIWSHHGNDIYYNNGYVGVGTDAPGGPLVVRADTSLDADSALFEVKNKNGQTVFAVYDGGVRAYVAEDTTSNKDNVRTHKMGFAVGGLVEEKTVGDEYFRVTPDSVRVWIKDDSRSNGGFAVAGLSPNKTVSDYYLNIYSGDTAYIIDPSEARIVWYPQKEAFLSGRVIIESPDSVGTNSFVTGFESKAIGNYSQAMGYKTISRGLNSTSIGFRAKAEGISSYALGANVLAADTNSFAFGHESAALAKSSFVFGQGDTAWALSSMALGYNNKAAGVASLALGAYTKALDTLSVAMGYNTISSGVNSVAMGDNSIATGSSALALGSSTKATGEAATSMGFGSIASGNASIAMGHICLASGLHSVAMGDSTQATKDDAISMGYKTFADGYFSTAMGNLTTARGDASFAIGYKTVADGYSSLAMGDSTNAKGDASFAVGVGSIAEGYASVAIGVNVDAKAAGSFVLGSYNESFSSVNDASLTSELFIIANGSPFASHNAFTVLKSGYIGVNTNTPDKLFTVDGDARVTGDIYYGPIGATTKYNKPDFVFMSNYDKNLDIVSVEKFIKRNGHLPWVTAAKDEKDGINMTRMSFETLEAVENQQLQIIQMNKKLSELEKLIKAQQKIIEKQQKELKKLKRRSFK